jgi:solute:Na+ symporter, SSS family
VFAVMPRLWHLAHEHDYVTAADVVRGQFRSKTLELAIAMTGVLAVMPYIALQLIGLATIIKALGLSGELPLIAAFVILALYAYSSGIKAPAAIAFAKDIMIYIAVVAAIAVIPLRLGGYAAVFEAADAAFKAKGSGNIILPSNQYVAYASLALGSALAAFMYPHTLTGVFASNGARTLRKNAILLPAYTLLLGLLALLGYMGHAAHLSVTSNNDVVPALFQALFPSWFVGFAFAAIALGALVPAAVMSIGAANLFARNFWRAHIDPEASPAREAQVAKIASLIVQTGALLAVIFLPIQFALDLQLFGGMWIIQILPALVFGLYTTWFKAPALLTGWAIGISSATYLALADDLKPLHALHLGTIEVTIFTGLLTLGLNIVITVVVQALFSTIGGSSAAKPAQ